MGQQYFIEISGITLCFHTEVFLHVVKAFQPFLCKKKTECVWNIYFIPVDDLPLLGDKVMYENQEYAIYQTLKGDLVYYYFDCLDRGQIYAVTQFDLKLKQVQVRYLPEKQKYLSEFGNSLFHVGWERIMAYENRFILHAACIETPLGGILFAGKSGIGKSTQADLWCRYAQGRLINGDRTILTKESEKWYAYGSPYAGSSKCYVNERCTVSAIILLQQDLKCHIRRLSEKEAFHQLFAETTVNSWDSEFVARICDMEIALSREIPVYEFCCTPDQDAVWLLWETLERNKE